ncbi:pentatricopeptide repeat-containing protein [Pyrus ussuriensis x Pyrus communis]|uniref:Pentatricopeptide repeat-containing protein n=1 Tax=Pyrus ussuriensis x Pyrus communis TaxID=2448454 RepID=A0A5N5I4T0_9ROSA|nr:pentatricopeptide repeat-containing protein [Pyrus ussuriensis x Pyrus communis]
MYAKCGSMTRAKVMFDKEALLAFQRMCAGKVGPNSVAFIGVLSACDRVGLFDKGLNLYEEMRKSYHIKPTIEHCGCVIDMYAGAGRLEEACKFVKSMPVEPNASSWRFRWGIRFGKWVHITISVPSTDHMKIQFSGLFQPQLNSYADYSRAMTTPV